MVPFSHGDGSSSERAGIRVCSKDHVAGKVGNAIIRICGHIIKEFLGLSGADGAECNKDFIDS